MFRISVFVLATLGFSQWLHGAEPASDPTRGDQNLANYFRQETEALRAGSLADVQSKEDWETQRPRFRRELLEMLGLDPLPERTDLQATVTGGHSREEFRVENVHFQSRPGLYVTGNLYLPAEIQGKLPAILYVCGHGAVKKDGVSYGNKVHYQRHGAWFARNGYVCLVIDTLQLGEIEGIHHGTHRYGMWWWLNRGYTPAGVEAWNCVRALDYLQSRPEVDGERLGVTGRSGGGAYSWWIAAIDDRIRCAVPVAGITDLENHVVDGCVEGHCDCMYMVNTYRWDYDQVAALVAPRPLLLSNTDSDGIFPLDGVVRIFNSVRRIYQLNDAKSQAGLNITAGGHQDTQELQTHAFRWFNQHLKQDTSLVEKTAVPFFSPDELKVFAELPQDERNTQIHESFVPAAVAPPVPSTLADWQSLRDGWLAVLQTKCFAGWPHDPPSLVLRPMQQVENDRLRVRVVDFDSQDNVPLRLYLTEPRERKQLTAVQLHVLDDQDWESFEQRLARHFPSLARSPSGVGESAGSSEKRLALPENTLIVYVAPRGIGPGAWDATPKKQIQHRRRFYLLGQSLDGMQVWDVRRAIQAVRSFSELQPLPLTVHGSRTMAGNVLYASLFEPDLSGLHLHALPGSHRDGPFYLNVERYLDLPQAVALAVERTAVQLDPPAAERWNWPQQLAARRGWSERLTITEPTR